MTKKISALTASTELSQIIDRAVGYDERFLVDRHGEPAVLIMSVSDYIRTIAPPPDWLEKVWKNSESEGTDQLTLDEIDEEIAAYRREKRALKP